MILNLSSHNRWYSLHRLEGSDLNFITQDNKNNKNIFLILNKFISCHQNNQLMCET